MSAVDLKQVPLGQAIELLDASYKRQYIAKFEGKPYSVIVTRDNVSRTGSFPGQEVPDPRWHVSIAGERSVPAWNAVAAIVHAVRPGVVFAIPMPPRSQWLNVHHHTIHVWEVHDETLARQWAREGAIAQAVGKGTPT